jgi:hypothetical protein
MGIYFSRTQPRGFDRSFQFPGFMFQQAGLPTSSHELLESDVLTAVGTGSACMQCTSSEYTQETLLGLYRILGLRKPRVKDVALPACGTEVRSQATRPRDLEHSSLSATRRTA